ncbi:MAG: hypothetical protein ACKOOH_01780 [Cyanobium sp.]
MTWDPTVLRKYSTTSHFRLLNQVRSELKSSPLARNKDGGLSVSMGRRGGNYRVAVDVRGAGPGLDASKVKRSGAAEYAATSLAQTPEALNGESSSFRDRLRAIDMR